MQDTSDLEFIEGVEDKLISIFLNDREAAIQGNSTLEVKDFYKSENQIIYSIIRNLIENGKNIDDIIVLEYIHANEDRQFSNYENYIHNALNEYSSSMNVNEYIDIIKKASIKRNLDKVCREIIDSKFDFSNFDDKISKEIKIFNDIAWSKKTNDIVDICGALSSSLNNTNISDAYSVVPTGFNSVDKLINGGFEKGELNLIAAAPGTGKTAFALNVFAHECEKLLHFDVSNQNRKPPIVYYVSLEMTAPQILERLISINTGKSFKFSNFNSNKYSELDKEIFQAAFDNISKYPAKMNANFKASITDIRGQISLLASSHDIKLVIIDHLHIMDYDRNNENQEIAGITKNLKQIAKEYQLPIVLLSQVNKSKNTFGGESKKFGFNKDQVKEEETSSNKIFLSDIRGSGAPVQDSSIIILMWNEKKNEKSTQLTVQIAKNRSGATGEVKLFLIGEASKFTEPSNRE